MIFLCASFTQTQIILVIVAFFTFRGHSRRKTFEKYTYTVVWTEPQIKKITNSEQQKYGKGVTPSNTHDNASDKPQYTLRKEQDK